MDKNFIELYNKYFEHEEELDNEIASWKRESETYSNIGDYAACGDIISDLLAIRRALSFHGGTF